jgi:hypothetical protein
MTGCVVATGVLVPLYTTSRAGISLDGAVKKCIPTNPTPQDLLSPVTGATTFSHATAHFCETLKNENLQPDHDDVCRARDTFGSIIDVLPDAA